MGVLGSKDESTLGNSQRFFKPENMFFPPADFLKGEKLTQPFRTLKKKVWTAYFPY